MEQSNRQQDAILLQLEQLRQQLAATVAFVKWMTEDELPVVKSGD